VILHRVHGRRPAVKKVFGFVLAILFAAVGSAQVPAPDGPKEPRDLGNAAAMHVYWYAPKTLEITHVETYLFKDERSCGAAITRALLIAMPHASEGDLVNAQCVRMHPPKEPEKPKGASEL
jgi:hypothetical protein